MISEYCGCAKPNPKIFRAACAASGVSPRDAAYVGDMYDIDAQGARDAGLTGIWLDRRRIAAPPHAPPIVCSLAELPALISRLDSQ
jgi:putative hydrolase of the HAD superfamily